MRRALLRSLLAASCALGLPVVGPAQEPVAIGAADDAVAARAKDSVLTWKELDPLLLRRRAMSQDGRAALRHLSESKLLEVLARERAIEVPEAFVEARWKELDQQIRGSGDARGVEAYLRRARLSEPEFRRFLALSFVQETLTRRALGLADGAAVNGDQQSLWIEEELASRGYVELPPPWKDGVVARGSGFEVRADEYARYLRLRLDPEDVEEDCYQLLLYRRMLARMPDLAPEKLSEYVTREIERRKSEAEADPRHKGVSYAQLLASQGIGFDTLPEDPAVLVAALSKLWVDRSYNDESLRRVYSSEREYFDGTVGPALETAMLFLRAGQFKNDFVSRTFAEAETELRALAPKIASRDDFRRLAKERSEDAASREAGGELGFVTPLGSRVPEEIRSEIARRISAAKPFERGLAGPVRLSTGCVLLWFESRRPAPAWEVMAQHVHRELRRRFVEEVLPRAGLVTAFEVE